MSVTNAQAYNSPVLITAVKRFMEQSPSKLFDNKKQKINIDKRASFNESSRAILRSWNKAF